VLNLKIFKSDIRNANRALIPVLSIIAQCSIYSYLQIYYLLKMGTQTDPEVHWVDVVYIFKFSIYFKNLIQYLYIFTILMKPLKICTIH